jgi:hypothetical protein
MNAEVKSFIDITILVISILTPLIIVFVCDKDNFIRRRKRKREDNRMHTI